MIKCEKKFWGFNYWGQLLFSVQSSRAYIGVLKYSGFYMGAIRMGLPSFGDVLLRNVFFWTTILMHSILPFPSILPKNIPTIFNVPPPKCWANLVGLKFYTTWCLVWWEWSANNRTNMHNIAYFTFENFNEMNNTDLILFAFLHCFII